MIGGVKENAYAKINLSLNVTGVADGYHLLDSVVTTVDLFDTVRVKKRRDKKITLSVSGRSEYVGQFIPERDNAYKAALLFSEKYGTDGADISVVKRIPLSGGMGGSSADASAVLRAMKKLYRIDCDLNGIASLLGSDVAYMSEGGFARISGRGEIIQPLGVDKILHAAVVYPLKGVFTGECFKRFDEISSSGSVADNERLIEWLKNDGEDFGGVCECKNALFSAAADILPEIAEAERAIKKLSPLACFMTGSGSCVCGLYQTRELCDWAAEKLDKLGYESFAVSSVRTKNK